MFEYKVAVFCCYYSVHFFGMQMCAHVHMVLMHSSVIDLFLSIEPNKQQLTEAKQLVKIQQCLIL